MIKAVEEISEWRVFIASDFSTHPEHDSSVEWEFSDGTRISAIYGKGLVWSDDSLPKQLPPNGVQRWRYTPRD